MKYIKDIREGENIREVYLCKSYQNLMAKNGKTYGSVKLQDKTGSLDAKIWDFNAGIEHFDAMDYVMVEGNVTLFQSSLQLSIRKARRCHEGEYDPKDYIPCTDKDIEKMYKELLSFIDKVKEPHLKQLLEGLFRNNAEFSKKFKNASAAKAVHHSFVGGLLEHTLSVTQTCDFFARQYPLLNGDLLLTAAMLHDVGKLFELSPFPENEYTDDGNLLGHIVIGDEKIARAIEHIPDFPKKLAMELRHCILAHHGELEYGSPKKPAIAEAFALNFADNMDAKMETLKELFAEADEKADWMGFQKLLDSNIRRTTI